VERIPELRSRLDGFARGRLTPRDFIPILPYDAEIPLDDVKRDFWMLLQRLEPFGSGNPVPVFVARNAKLVQPPRLLKEKHLKLRVMSGQRKPNGQIQRAYDALGWRMADRAAQEPLAPGAALDLAFTVDYNEHPDFGGVQLNLLDFQSAEKAVSAAVAAES